MGIISLIIVLRVVLWVVLILGSIFLFFAAYSIYTNLTTGVPWAKVPRANVYRIFKELGLPADSLVTIWARATGGCCLRQNRSAGARSALNCRFILTLKLV